MSDPYFSLVILCYRSADTITPFVEKVHKMMSNFNFKWELILVGNYVEGQADETPKVVRSISERLPNVRYISFPKKGMMGWDMKSGMNEAKGKYVGVIDGDGQFPIEAIASCILKLELEGLDFVKTYRVLRHDGFYRKLISSVYNGIFRMLFGMKIYDANSKPKIMLNSKYREMNLQSDDWFTDAEIMIRAKEMGLKIGETPVHFSSISGRTSFVRPQAIIEFFLNLIRYRFFRKK